MNEIQRFLYTQTSRVLENKEKKRTILFSSEVTGSTFLNRSVYINRFDGVFQSSDIQTEDYSSSFFCDVQQDKFWDFLYSNLWNDKGILRVLSGELYTALDISLNEMLQANKISRHVTTAYLKVKGKAKKDELKLDLSPETVQVEFTYYNRIHLTGFPFSDIETGVQIANNLTLKADSPSEVSIKKFSKEKSDIEVDPESEKSYSVSSANQPSIEPHVIKINLGHFPCPITHEIENDVESDCDPLENEIQRGNWIANDTSLEKEYLMHTSLRSTTDRGELQESNFADRKQLNKLPSFKSSKQEEEADAKERLLMPISIDINLSVLGKIMEREKFLKFKKMTPKERKKFYLSDERIKKVEKLDSEDIEEINWDIPLQVSRKTSQKQDKTMDIKNMREFATLVLGILESPSIYRSLIWMGKCEEEEKAKNTPSVTTTAPVRVTRTNFNMENDEGLTALQLESKGKLFKSRNKRSMVKAFTYHPKFFKPNKIDPMFETKRLRRSYSPEYYKERYTWEKEGQCQFRLTKTKITIPELSLCKLEISSERILKALGDFIVRKERVISSKGMNLISIAFIRPIYLNNLFF